MMYYNTPGSRYTLFCGGDNFSAHALTLLGQRYNITYMEYNYICLLPNTSDFAVLSGIR